MSDDQFIPEDTFKILIATDCHLGYDFNKRRGTESNDSFVTFEEILKLANDHEVDFILLGGDLFHDTKPSQAVLIKCMDLLRKYCLGSREIKMQLLTDPNVVFKHCTHKIANYEDPNFNISLPVFSIHGNHDDPSYGAIGSMDLLSVSGLINYFGKWTDLAQIEIPPLVFKKGQNHIALYGLSYINDQRLSRLFRDCKVNLLQTEELSNCFNILSLHQNRVKHGYFTNIPEDKLPNFLDLIIWGHEHECRIKPEYVPGKNYCITQPGSSIATSLSEGEAVPKCVGLLTVGIDTFKLRKLQLKTVRPFVYDSIILANHDIEDCHKPMSKCVYDFADNYIHNELIPRAALQLTGHPDQPIQPLIRLRIFYTKEEETFDIISLAQKYCDDVANPMDMILFRKERQLGVKRDSDTYHDNDDIQDYADAFDTELSDVEWTNRVQTKVKEYFKLDENKDKMTVLTVDALNEALNRFVRGGDQDAFKSVIKHEINTASEYLLNKDVPTRSSMVKEVIRFRNERLEKEEEYVQEIRGIFTQHSNENNISDTADLTRANAFDTSDVGIEVPVEKSTKSRRARGSSGTRGSRGARGSRGVSAKKIHQK